MFIETTPRPCGLSEPARAGWRGRRCGVTFDDCRDSASRFQYRGGYLRHRGARLVERFRRRPLLTGRATILLVVRRRPEGIPLGRWVYQENSPERGG
jgi:hypothetical protein